jgi:hypothetical protein
MEAALRVSMLALAVTQLLALMATKFSGAQQTRDAPNGHRRCDAGQNPNDLSLAAKATVSRSDIL